MADERSGFEPELSKSLEVTGLEPAIRPRLVSLDGIDLTLLAHTTFSDEITGVIATPQAGKPILVFGRGPYTYVSIDVASGVGRSLALPGDEMLVALDDEGRFYLLGDGSRTLVRYSPDLVEDFRMALRDQRDVSIGRDGKIYTWLFRSKEMEVYDPDGNLLRVLEHGWGPYSLAVDESGVIWLGEASFCHVIEISPTTGESRSFIDPKEDFTAENLFTYTYAMNFDRRGNLWTFNGQGDVGMTIISPDKTQYLRFASKDVGTEYQQSEPIPSPWHDEVYLVAGSHSLSLFRPTLCGWKDIIADIYANFPS